MKEYFNIIPNIIQKITRKEKINTRFNINDICYRLDHNLIVSSKVTDIFLKDGKIDTIYKLKDNTYFHEGNYNFYKDKDELIKDLLKNIYNTTKENK